MQFSLVIPAYNTEDLIENCLHSVLNQNFDGSSFEVILVDDCSTDSTFQIASRLAADHNNLLVTRTAENSGPGAARNIGLSKASGNWVLFVDSDDYLHCEALSKLHAFLDRNNGASLDGVGFNWEYDLTSSGPEQFHASGRRDHGLLRLTKDRLINEYLSLHMDGSVIYTAIRRQLIVENNLQFASGYHEDVDYIFRVYWHARKISYLDEVLYFKRRRFNSIVDTVSAQHIQGFMRAWKAIGVFVAADDSDRWQEFLPYYKSGLVGVIATRAREIFRRSSGPKHAAELYQELYRCWLGSFASTEDFLKLRPKTKYELIALNFIKTMQDQSLNTKQKANRILKYIGEIVGKSWSCIDLHHSLFLAPDQIRTCCKRFFVDGEMRGDVVLLDLSEGDPDHITAETILKVKQELHAKINCGKPSVCDGCPFLEFKGWGPLSSLEIKYLSLEYHSVCNLRCSYCSETFYGGLKPRYDINALVDGLLNQNAMENCRTVVWGGGEPVLDNNFAALIEKLVNCMPGTSQRVLTNAVKYSEMVEKLLAEDKISITTSIDAGTEETYLLVRGRPGLRELLANLEKYATANSSNVTVKYIFVEENGSFEEVKAFVSLIREFNLCSCNFQISCDFKKEMVSCDAAISMIGMYGLLTDAGCRLVYFDDLLRQRLGGTHTDSEEYIKSKLTELDLGHVLAPIKLFSAMSR